MQAYLYRWTAVAALVLALACYVPSCGGGSRALTSLDGSAPTAPAGGLNLDELAAALAGHETPAGVDPEVYSRLTGELLSVLREAGEARAASAPPAGARNAVGDLALVGSEALGFRLEWTYVNVGDYDRNGEVGVSDLTPVGLHFGAREGDPYWEEARVADGDGNGEINVSDITPIGQNFLSQMTGYEVFSSADITDFPAAPDDPNGAGAVSLGTVELVSGSPDRQSRLRLGFDLDEMGQSYWVRPVFAGEYGAASNRLDLQIELKPETVIIDSETSALLTDFTNNVLTFSASTAQLAGLGAGNVFTSGPLDAAPAGFMLSVTEVAGAGPVTVSGEPADLRDAVARASISAYIPLQVNAVKSSSSAWPDVEWDPAKTSSAKLGIPFFLSFDNVPVGSNVKVSGNALLWPALVLNIELGPTVIDRLDFGASCEVSGGITLEGEVGGNWDQEITLYTWEFTPIVFTLASFPIVLEPSIDLVLGSNGDCTEYFSASAGLDAALEGTIGYKDGDWGFHKSYGAEFSAPDPIIYGALNSDTYTGARLKLLLYGQVGGFGTLTTGFRINADTSANPWWTVCAFVKGTIGVDLLLLKQDYVMFDECLLQKDAGGPFSELPGSSSWGYTLDHDATADYDVFQAVLPLSDGRVAAAGSSFLHPIIVMQDPLGNVVWQKELDEPGEIHDLTRAPDGGIIAAGKYIADGLIMKVDQAGNLLWARSVGGPKSDALYAVEPLDGGGYLAVGDYITDEAASEAWAVLLNEDGTVAASTTYGMADGDEFNSLTRNPDGSLYAAGVYSNYDDAWFAKFDSAGTAQWHKRIYFTGETADPYDEWATGVAADGTGGCYITGQTNRGALTLWVVRYDPAGHGWVRLVDNDDFALTWDVTDIIGLRDGGLALSGRTGSAGPLGQRDGFVICFSGGGGLNWAAAYGGDDEDGLWAIGEKLGAAGIFAAGHSKSFRGDGEQDAMVLLLRPGGTISYTEGIGAGRSYLTGNVIDDEYLTEHFANLKPSTAAVSPTEEALTGALADFGATPVKL